MIATDELTLADATLRGTYLADVATSGGSVQLVFVNGTLIYLKCPAAVKNSSC